VNSSIVEQVDKKLMIYPNPAKNTIHLKGIDRIVKIQIINFEGKIIKQSTTNKTLDISELKPGIYILKSNGYQSKILMKTE
ncbi:MAG TPA: T9SS type A sorting domain-containing protein, partial [Tangfeifania sp.]|nr:T9SS type A sorting domain-containing protein [Tangfeifania sp.]